MRPNSMFFINFVFINIYFFLLIINCFNIDTEFPIVFESKSNHNFDDYFGLSVQMLTIDNEVIFIIGSPKTNSTLYNVEESGTVFRCRLYSDDTTDCNEIYLDFQRIAASNRRLQKKVDVKPTNHMFLGGTIIARPNSAQVVVCGHKWSQELFHNRPEHQINPTGSCFSLDLSKPRDTPIGIFPLTDPNLQFLYNTYYYSHSMTGFSAAFTSSGQHLLLGAPGFNQWRGTFLETESIDSNQLIGEQFLLQKNRSQSNTESYAGYSLVSGHFFAGTQNSVAVGAPRDEKYRGRVYIYNLQNSIHSEDTTTQFTHINGIQTGEYFGSTLLSVNLNADKFSDLIIGAPFYSTQESGDLGRVFVYLSNGNGFNLPTILSASDSSNARFGTALADLGDLNVDGYNDIGIGAPYEDQNGVVYIYFGSKNGVSTKFAQRISAKENLRYINLKGFGISISGDRDVDQNNYSDILIGSYLSNKAVLLRTKAIVNIKANIEFNSSFVNINDKNCEYIEPNTRIKKKSTCVRLTYCVGYTGSYVPSKLLFNLTLRMDSRRGENPRCFTQYENTIKTELNKIQEIYLNKDFCFDELIVYLKNTTSIDDIFTPMDFTLSSSVMQIQSKNTFCKNCPIIGSNRNTSNQLHFKTGCRTDQKCISTLKLFTRSLLNGIPQKTTDSVEIFEGFHKNFTLITSVVNSGEPSYLTKILISTKPRLNLLKQDSLCKIINNNSQNNTEFNSIECDVGNPLNPNLKEEVLIPFDISELDPETDILEIDIEVKTASEVTKDSHLSDNFEINIIRNASLEIFGSSDLTEIVYESESQRKSDFIPFTGIFQLTKQNWSSIQSVLIEMQIPTLFNKQSLIFQPIIDQQINAQNRGVPINCNQTISGLPALPIKSSENRRTKRDANENEKRKTLKLDCKSHISCQTMQCFAGPFDNERQTAKFFIHSALNIKTIESIFGQKYDKIEFIIKTKSSILDQKISSKSAQISTNFLFKRLDLKKDSIEKWIIFVSIGVGFLILIIIIVILCKFGFFKRMKLEEGVEEENKNQLNSETNDKIESNSLLEFDENDEKDIEFRK